MSPRSVLLVCLTLVGCGQTSTDPPSNGGGGGGGSGGSLGCAGPHWRWIPPAPGATERVESPATRLGNDVLVWGGRAAAPRGDGVRISASSPGAGATAVPAKGAPSPRDGHAMATVGGVVLVWGGYDNSPAVLGDGARLNATGTAWSPIAGVGAPSARSVDKFGVAGGGLLVWDGFASDGTFLGDAALYDPASDTWTTVEPAPFLCLECVTVSAGVHGVLTYGVKGDTKEVAGYLFDSKSRKWKLVPANGQLGGRSGAIAVWSEATQEAIIWGGAEGVEYRSDGARFSLLDWEWKSMSSAGAPVARSGAGGAVLPALGVAGKLVVFGGTGAEGPLDSGGIYDIASDTWSQLPTGACTPPARWMHAVATLGPGDQALIWGGIGEEKQSFPPEQGWVLSPE